MRAIPIEYGFNMVDAPLHYIGLKAALNNFIFSNKAIKDNNGNEIIGKRALEFLYDNDPFFKGMMDKTAHGLIDYDPHVFRQYAKFAGASSDWVDQCVAELDGMRELVQGIRTKQFKREMLDCSDKNGLPRLQPSYTKPGVVFMDEILSERQAKSQQHYDTQAIDMLRQYNVDLDKTAHGLALSTVFYDGEVQSQKAVKERLGYNPFKPSRDIDELAIDAEIKDNLAFTISESNRNKPLFAPGIKAGVDNVQYIAR
jgi:hypothetical protein